MLPRVYEQSQEQKHGTMTQFVTDSPTLHIVQNTFPEHATGRKHKAMSGSLFWLHRGLPETVTQFKLPFTSHLSLLINETISIKNIYSYFMEFLITSLCQYFLQIYQNHIHILTSGCYTEN
jgi:hypothetical protein